MFRKFKFVMVLALSTCALAQHKNTQPVALESASPDATTTCKVTYTSGSGGTASQFCVTANGNIAQYSVAGSEMINSGQVGEGYGICDVTGGRSYFDYAYTDSGNWQSPTFSQSGNTVTVTRKTSDGNWQLKQTIVNLPAGGAFPASVHVSMALKNLTGITREAVLLRFADVDADGTNANNDFDFTSQTAYGTEPAGFFAGRGLSITNNTFDPAITVGSFTLADFHGPDPCNAGANGAPQPFHGDGSLVQWHLFDAGPAATRTAVSTYRPM